MSLTRTFEKNNLQLNQQFIKCVIPGNKDMSATRLYVPDILHHHVLNVVLVLLVCLKAPFNLKPPRRPSHSSCLWSHLVTGKNFFSCRQFHIFLSHFLEWKKENAADKKHLFSPSNYGPPDCVIQPRTRWHESSTRDFSIILISWRCGHAQASTVFYFLLYHTWKMLIM